MSLSPAIAVGQAAFRRRHRLGPAVLLVATAACAPEPAPPPSPPVAAPARPSVAVVGLASAGVSGLASGVRAGLERLRAHDPRGAQQLLQCAAVLAAEHAGFQALARRARAGMDVA